MAKAEFEVDSAGYPDIVGFWGIDPGCPEKNGKPQYKKLITPGLAFHTPGKDKKGSHRVWWNKKSWQFDSCGSGKGADKPYTNPSQSATIPLDGWQTLKAPGADPMPSIVLVLPVDVRKAALRASVSMRVGSCPCQRFAPPSYVRVELL